MKRNRFYTIRRDDDGDVLLIRNDAGEITNKLIAPAASQKLWNHSPTGFNCGYGGSGPAQLALAILLDFTDDDELAVEFHQHFKREFIARLPENGGSIASAEIIRFVESRINLEPTEEKGG